MKKFFKYILVSALFLTCFVFKSGAQNITAGAKLQQYTIRIGDQTKLFIVVHQPVGAKVNFPQLADSIVSKVQLVSAAKPDTVIDQNDKSAETVTRSYLITSFDVGVYTIPSFSLGTAGAVVKTNELTLQVETVKVDTTKSIYDIKQPLTVSYTFLDWLKDNWVSVFIPLLAIAALGIWYWYHKRKPKPVFIEKPKEIFIPAHTIALKKLNALRDKKLWQQDEHKPYYIELSDILREYLEKRFSIQSHEQTTDEIFAMVSRLAIGRDLKEQLRKILTLSDLVKFAKEHPMPAENEQCMENAIDFVTKTQNREPVMPEGGPINV